MKNKTDYTRPSAEKVADKPVEKTEKKPRRKATKRMGVVKAEKMYLRSSPKKANNVLKILDKGFEFAIDGEEGLWYKVSLNNGEIHGYVMKECVDEVIK